MADDALEIRAVAVGARLAALVRRSADRCWSERTHRVFCPICAARARNAGTRNAHRDSRHHRALPLRAESDVYCGVRYCVRPGNAFRKRTHDGVRDLCLAGICGICSSLRGADTAAQIWRGVQEVLLQRAPLDSAVEAVERCRRIGLADRLLGIGDGGRDRERSVDFRHPKEFHDAIVHACYDELSVVALARDVIVDDGAHSG